MNTAQMSCGPSSLDELRRRGVFLFSAVIWTTCGGFVLVAFGYLIFLANNLLAFASRLRTAVGGHTPATGQDWVLVGACLVIGIVPVVGLCFCWRWYRRQWNSRLATVWVSRDLQQRHCRIANLPIVSGEPASRRKAEYLRDLLATPQWSSHRTAAPLAVNLDLAEYRSASEAVLLDIEKDVTERAIATGLIVGVSSSSRMDAITILLAAFEIQMHVLCRLGKRPSFGMWVELIKRCGSSLFFNTYLNREETMGVSFAIKQAGLGIHAAGEMLGEGGHALSDFDVNDALDQLLGDHGLPESAKLAICGGAMAAGLGMGVGGVGLRVIGQAIESIGDELLQGVLAGAALYFHGMALASECLALDVQHRNSAAMTRTFRDGLSAVTKTAAAILREQVKSRTDAYRARRRMALRQASKQLGVDAWGAVRSAFFRKPKADAVSGD
jgi:hypothetical protein